MQNNLLNQMGAAYATAIDPNKFGQWQTLSSIPRSTLGGTPTAAPQAMENKLPGGTVGGINKPNISNDPIAAPQTGGEYPKPAAGGPASAIGPSPQPAGGNGAGVVPAAVAAAGRTQSPAAAAAVGAPKLDLSNMPEITGMSDESRRRIEDALYSKMTSRLDPRFSQQQQDLAAQLAAQGITQGSSAYGAEQDIFNRSRNDAYSNATNDSILMGGQEASRMMADQLAHRGQIFNERRADVDVQGRNADRTSSENMQAAAHAASSGAQAAALAQQREMWGTDRADRLAQQSFMNEMAGVDFSNRTRSQQLAEAMMLRRSPAEDLAALRAATNPNFGNTNSGANVQAAPYAQSAYNTYQGQMNQYNADVGSQNAQTGAIASVAAAAIAAF
jgi:hypothetical protein